MEIATQQSETQKKKRSLDQDPQYFGAYLNMARHNVFLIVNHLAAKFNLNELSEEEEIKNETCFLTKEITESPNHVYSLLTKYLTVTKVFNADLLPKSEKESASFAQDSTDFKQLATSLKQLFIELDEFRNDYSHYFSSAFDKENIQRKSKIEASVGVFLRENFVRATEYTAQRFKDVFSEEDFSICKNYTLVSPSNQITEQGLVFFICMFLEREAAFQFINKIKGFKNTAKKPFLATREVFLAFCVNLPSDKFISDNTEQAWQLDMLSYLSRCPNELYHSLDEESKKEFQPQLDVDRLQNVKENSINEEDLFLDYEEYISQITTQKRHTDRFPYFALRYLDESNSFVPSFQIDLGKAIVKSYPKSFLNREATRNIIENVRVFGKLKGYQVSDSETIEQKTLKIALKEDVTFSQYAPHFALENNKIGISFKQSKVSKGFYQTHTVDAMLSIHELPKVALLEILEKGKASSIIADFLAINQEKILNEAFIEQIKRQLSFKPIKRHFFSDNLLSITTTEDIEASIKACTTQIKKLDSYHKKNELAQKKTKLNSLYYARYVRDSNKRKEVISQILKQWNLSTSQIPSRILDYWLNITDNDPEITLKNRIKAEKKDCKKRLKDLENRKGPKIGEMATFIAKDILHLVIDKNTKQKITSFYYDKLQECLALYADVERKQIFIDLIGKELKLSNKTTGHPFLGDLNLQNIKNTKEFYRQYLEAKGTKGVNELTIDRKTGRHKQTIKETNWIYSTFYCVTNDAKTHKKMVSISVPDSKPIPYDFAKLLKKPLTIQEWLRNVANGCKDHEKANPQKKAVDLPTNLFDAPLIHLLKQKAHIANLDTQKHNFSKLLALWLHDCQPFYNYRRAYAIEEVPICFTPTQGSFNEHYQDKVRPIFEAMKARRKEENSLLSDGQRQKPPVQEKDVWSKLKKTIDENEKVIRFYQTKDRILLLMLNELFPTEKGGNLRLAEISPLVEKSPLNQPITIEQKVTGYVHTDSNGNRLKKSEKKEVTKTIFDVNRKRKDFGVFKKFIKDRRLPDLFEYYDDEKIPLQQLREELSQYNKYKDLILDKVFELEKLIISKATESELENEILNQGNYSNVQHLPYLKYLKARNLIDDQSLTLLKTVRNKFSHNQFPPKGIMNQFITWNEGESFSQQIYDRYTLEIDRIIAKL